MMSYYNYYAPAFISVQSLKLECSPFCALTRHSVHGTSLHVSQIALLLTLHCSIMTLCIIVQLDMYACIVYPPTVIPTPPMAIASHVIQGLQIENPPLVASPANNAGQTTGGGLGLLVHVLKICWMVIWARLQGIWNDLILPMAILVPVLVSSRLTSWRGCCQAKCCSDDWWIEST